jgi:hypothetical protein
VTNYYTSTAPIETEMVVDAFDATNGVEQIATTHNATFIAQNGIEYVAGTAIEVAGACVPEVYLFLLANMIWQTLFDTLTAVQPKYKYFQTGYGEICA